MKKSPGSSNPSKNFDVKKSDFTGTSGGAPKGSFPINNLAKARSTLKLARNAPFPREIKEAIYKKYPDLKKGEK